MGGIYFTCDLNYYFVYDFVIYVLGLHLQMICMIMIFVFWKVLGEEELYMIRYILLGYNSCFYIKKL